MDNEIIKKIQEVIDKDPPRMTDKQKLRIQEIYDWLDFSRKTIGNIQID